MLLAALVDCSAKVAATRSRRAKVEAISQLLRATPDPELEIAVSWLSGRLRQGRLGVGWRATQGLPGPAARPTLTLLEVDGTLSELATLAGPGVAARRQLLLAGLWSRATTPEQVLLGGLLGGELRQGALRGVMAEAVAAAAEVAPAELRRAAMLAGDLVPAAVAALTGGEAALAGFRLQVGTPVQPMLAQSASSLAEALERLRPAALEWKLDGVRIQVHRRGDEVQVFTRTLERITSRVPEVVQAALSLAATSVILDGEALVLDAGGRPRPFQETSARVASRGAVEPLRARWPLSPFFFDLLHLDGQDLIDRTTAARIELARTLVPERLAVPRLLEPDPGRAQEFLEQALARGHEGVMVKALAAPYLAGRRGGSWIKVKPRHTLDLVVLAAEWGHGRRAGWLSNLHLGARGPQGGLVMLGKTFKGLTDELLAWQTGALLAREQYRSGITVFVRPELVVEVAFDGLQASSRYPGGVALRFARVVRYRPDKPADLADTLETVKSLGGPASDLEPGASSGAL